MTKSDVNLSTEEVFPIRSYGKGELACLYIHNVQQSRNSTSGFGKRPDWNRNFWKQE